jgi:hypothetical protein
MDFRYTLYNSYVLGGKAAQTALDELAALSHASLIVDRALVRAGCRAIAAFQALLLVLQTDIGMGIRQLKAKSEAFCDMAMWRYD